MRLKKRLRKDQSFDCYASNHYELDIEYRGWVDSSAG